MLPAQWPEVGRHGPSIAVHASNLRDDIARLSGHVTEGATHVPAQIVRQSLSSVESFLNTLDDAANSPSSQIISSSVRKHTQLQRAEVTSEESHHSALVLVSLKGTKINLVEDKSKGALNTVTCDTYVRWTDSKSVERVGDTLYHYSLHRRDRTIRLLRIDPELDPRIDICGQLSIVSLHDHPPYVALCLTTLLPQYCMKGATDSREKIYGLLGLVRWNQAQS